MFVSRRSTPSNLQPPPAHQHSQTPRVLSMPFDIKFHAHNNAPKPPTPTGISPIDLSSR